MDERSYNTKVYGKDPDYTECEHCDGTGFIYNDIVNEVGDPTTEKEQCPKCDEGWILIED